MCLCYLFIFEIRCCLTESIPPLKGVRDGLFNSLQTTSVEMCNVGTTFLFAVQAALELAHHVTPSGARESQLTQRQPQRSRMAQQPLNVTVRFGLDRKSGG